jgi:Asp/Glu/hydantoin racemase
MEGRSEFNEVIIEAKRTAMDLDKIEAEVLATTSAMISTHPEIRGVVLECTDMPPYAHRLQARFGLPVFDLTTLATMVHDAVCRTPYLGLMPRN